MKKLLLILTLFFCALVKINAQTQPTVCTSPTSYNYDEEVTWYFNLEGNTSVTAGENLYFYSWSPTVLQASVLLANEGNMLWSLTFTPTTLYGVTVADIENAGDSAFWFNIQNDTGVVIAADYSLKEQLRLGNSCSGIAPSSADSTFLVNFGSEPITNPDTNSNHWTNVEAKTTVYDLTDNGGSGRYQITATGGFISNNNSDFINPDAGILGDMAIVEATKSYLYLSGTGTGTITISGLETNRLHKLSIFGSRNTTSTRETRYTVKGLSTEFGVLQTSGVDIATNTALNTNDDEFYVVNAFPDAQGKIVIDVAIESGGFGYINMLKIEEILSPTLTFNGSTDSDWATASNWNDNVVPSELYSTVIPASQNVTISAATNAVTKDLSVDGSGSLTINAGGSLIVNGISTGNVTYNRTLTSQPSNEDGWHLVSSPVAGEVFDNDYVANNTIDLGTGANRGVATYSNGWSYLQSNSSISSTSGIGYAMKRSADGTVGFTGAINTADVNSVAVSASATDFVLLGVPYTAYMSSDTFLTANANLDQSQIWVWEQGTTGGSYIAATAKADNFILAPGQGFFVKKANTDATVNFAESNQQANADTFKKSSRTEVKLIVNDGKIERFAKMYYLNNVTQGYDLGYEGETFGGVETNFDIFSHLVAEDEGKNYQVQSLPLSEMESTIVPLGLKVGSDQEVTISAETLNLPTDLKVYLEDRLTNTFTRLDDKNASYKVQVASGTTEGRFYLHTSAKSVLSTDTDFLNSVSIYKANTTTLKIVGLSEGEASVKLFNLLGKRVMTKKFNTTGVKELTLPNLSRGIYIVKVETKNGKLNKKIVLE